MSATFWTIAALFCGVAILILLVPVWLHKKRGGRWSLEGVVASLLIAPLAIGLYSLVSNWNPELAERVNQEDALLEQIEQHLQSNPNDLRGWQLLASSYMQLGRYDEARAAYERLWALTPQHDDDLKIAYAESQILADRSSLTGDAGRLIEEVLASRPNDPKALWYGGHVALQLGRDDDVRARWSRLLTMNIPEEVSRVVQMQLAELNAGAAQAAEPPPSGAEIKLNVTLGEGRSLTALAPTAQLFVMALAPEGTGPPLADIRRPPSAVPGEFSLSDANAMIQGRSLAAYPEIKVVARLSNSGQPIAQPGDWFAEAVVRPSAGEPVALVIDQVVQ
ncbi:MAG TPA: tetratricopeptide repeat protein [Gammaproteobacteria bacterium]|nr:tetratricopeptide repeat protein [Gammaproteobacteria bacterium]